MAEITEGERMLIKKFNDNNVNFKDYTNLIKVEIWMLSSLVNIEDATQSLLTDAKLMARDIKVASKKLLGILEKRDSKNFAMVREESKGEYQSDTKFFTKLATHMSTNLHSEVDRIAFTSLLDNVEPMREFVSEDGKAKYYYGSMKVPKDYIRITKAQAKEQFMLGRPMLCSCKVTGTAVYIPEIGRPTGAKFVSTLKSIANEQEIVKQAFYIQKQD